MTSASNPGPSSESSPTSLPREDAPSAPVLLEKKTWGAVNQELKQALESWEALNDQLGEKKSPEAEQLLEVKKLLGELRQKLKQFSE